MQAARDIYDEGSGQMIEVQKTPMPKFKCENC